MPSPSAEPGAEPGLRASGLRLVAHLPPRIAARLPRIRLPQAGLRGRRLPGLLPRSLRARLVIAFAAVVTLAIAIVLVTLPNLLNGYFAGQERKNLDARAQVIATVVSLTVGRTTGGSAAPIVLATDPPTVSPELAAAFGSPDDPDGLLNEITQSVGQADLELTISLGPNQPNAVAYRAAIPYDPPTVTPGQEPDTIGDVYTFTVPDLYWSQSARLAPQRLFTLRLSNPWTFRAQALRDVVGVMLLAGVVALLLAVILSVLFASRLTTPIRRLTAASRALAEGEFDARVPEPTTGAPELGELATAFNRMAARLEESVELIRRDRDRGRDFLADVSHELRTPLAALRTFNELLQEGADTEPATRAEFLESSRGQIERLDWLAQNLLELSKLDSGLVALDLRPEDLRVAIENALEQAAPAAQRKDVTLSADLPDQSVRQRHDPQRLGQVLANLVGNAVKFTPAGGAVRIALRSLPDGAEIKVRDDGVGIAPDELPHVFERFYRGTRAAESRASGSGLGLSIVRSIVEMHGGRVSVESHLGRGTEVTVRLPREVAGSSPPAAPA
jgi:signal transduction histidine kinase